MSREMTLDKASEYNVLLIDTTLYNQSAKLAVFIGINKFSRLFFFKNNRRLQSRALKNAKKGGKPHHKVCLPALIVKNNR